MNTGETIINLTILAVVVLTQLGTHVVDRRRFIVPLLVVATAGYGYLHDAPTIGHDAAFYLDGALAGTLLGVLAAALVRVQRDPHGTITATAGAAFLTVWLLAIGGRMLFAYAATHTTFGEHVAHFSRQHLIAGPDAWRAMFVTMALTMVLGRLLILAARTTQLRRSPAHSAA